MKKDSCSSLPKYAWFIEKYKRFWYPTAIQFSAPIGRTISEATLLNYVMRLHGSLEVWEKRTMLQLLTASCMHTDETSMRVNKQNHWIHVYSAGELTLKMIHLKRGKQAMDDIGIITGLFRIKASIAVFQ